MEKEEFPPFVEAKTIGPFGTAAQKGKEEEREEEGRRTNKGEG